MGVQLIVPNKHLQMNGLPRASDPNSEYFNAIVTFRMEIAAYDCSIFYRKEKHFINTDTNNY